MLRLVLATAALAMSLAAQASDRRPADRASDAPTRQDRLLGDYGALRSIAARCPDIYPPDPASRGFTLGGATRRVLEQLVTADPGACPGVPQAGLAELRRRLGDPERGEVDLFMLGLAWQAAEQGLGMARDPALADRYGRILWLYSASPPPLPRWRQAERDAWLRQPDAMALLAARVAANEGRVLSDRDEDLRLVMRRLAELYLRRGGPGYDPRRAVALLERLGMALRAAELLSNGTDMPPDYPRAARLLLPRVSEPPNAAREERRLLLRIARATAAAATTPLQKAQALRLFFAATAHDRSIAAAEIGALMRASGPMHRETLRPRDAECARNFTRMAEIIDMLAPYAGSRPAAPASIRLRGLIGPDNRIVQVDLVRSSGSAAYDGAVLRVWARVAGRIRMWDTARDHFTLVDFPPIPVIPAGRLWDVCLVGEDERD